MVGRIRRASGVSEVEVKLFERFSGARLITTRDSFSISRTPSLLTILLIRTVKSKQGNTHTSNELGVLGTIANRRECM